MVEYPYLMQIKLLQKLLAMVKGTHYLLGRDSTVIDIGGQDTKIITFRQR